MPNPQSRIPDPAAIDALLLDLGGVVMEIDFDRIFASWAKHAGMPPSMVKARFSFDAPYEQHERGEIDAAAYFASLRGSLGVELSDAQLEEGWNELFVGEVPGIVALLRRARDRMPLYAFTNTNPTHQAVWSRRYSDVLGMFREVFTSWEIGRRKPDPGAFGAVAARMGVHPSRILFFDDSAQNVEGASARGLHAVLVKSAADVERSLEALLD